MSVEPFTIHVPQDVLSDLEERLSRTRWPDEIIGSEWDYGSNLAYVKELAEYWRSDFDWRSQEAAINRFSPISGPRWTDWECISFTNEDRGRAPCL